MADLKITRGPYRVMRACCREGNCFTCHARFDKSRRHRVLQLDRLSKATAEAVAHNWRDYEPTIERAPKSPPVG